MARPIIDVRLFGDKELGRALGKLPAASQKKAIRFALRASAKRIRTRVVGNLTGDPVDTHSGRLLAGVLATNVRSLGRSRSALGAGWDMPTRPELGIDPKDKWYYPAAIEYGTVERTGRGSVDELRPFRSAVDDHRARELMTIGRDVGKGIERQWRRLNRT